MGLNDVAIMAFFGWTPYFSLSHSADPAKCFDVGNFVFSASRLTSYHTNVFS